MCSVQNLVFLHYIFFLKSELKQTFSENMQCIFEKEKSPFFEGSVLYKGKNSKKRKILFSRHLAEKKKKLILRCHKVMLSDKLCFLLLRLVVGGFRSLAVPHSGGFTPIGRAALAVTGLSALPQSLVSLLETSGGLESFPTQAPFLQFRSVTLEIKPYSAAAQCLTTTKNLSVFLRYRLSVGCEVLKALKLLLYRPF